MSSIVSRSPPFSGSVSHSNERRWIAIRLGTSRTLFRRAKLRRTRGASTAGTRATPSRGRNFGGDRGEAVRGHADAPRYHTDRRPPPMGAVDSHGPRSGAPYVAGERRWGAGGAYR